MFTTVLNLQKIQKRKHYKHIVLYSDTGKNIQTKNELKYYCINYETKEINDYLRNTTDDSKYYICEINHKYNGTLYTLLTSTNYEYEQNPDILKYYISECVHAIKYIHSKHIAHTYLCSEYIVIANDGTIRIPITDHVVNLNKNLKINHDYYPPDFPKNPSKSDIYSLDWIMLGTIIYDLTQKKILSIHNTSEENISLLSLIKDKDLRELLIGLIVGKNPDYIYKYNAKFNGDDILKSKWIKTEIPFDTIDAPYVFIEDTNTWMYTWNITRYK
jgi:hypothetical protein